MRLAAALSVLALATAPALSQEPRVALETIATDLVSPVFATAPAGDSRLFVLEQAGRILIVADGEVKDTPFLDLSAEVSGGNEQGLLGLAFHPDYASNGRFYVNYTDRNGDTQVVGYTVSADADVADPASGQTVFSIDQPFANHNGGWVGFGPDGLLYVGTGDGGAGGDPDNRAQNPDELLGKILSVDVDAGGGPEVFALGARNPWRIAFDGDLMYIADVGQGQYEEVSVLTLTDRGANLGWRQMEGPACFEAGCDPSQFVAPIHTYAHADGGCSITGGYVYRGTALPELAGQYFFSDFCDPRIRSFTYADGAAGEVTDWSEQLGAPGAITSFGLDAAGELYVMTIEGQLLKLVPAA